MLDNSPSVRGPCWYTSTTSTGSRNRYGMASTVKARATTMSATSNPSLRTYRSPAPMSRRNDGFPVDDDPRGLAEWRTRLVHSTASRSEARTTT